MYSLRSTALPLSLTSPVTIIQSSADCAPGTPHMPRLCTPQRRPRPGAVGAVGAAVAPGVPRIHASASLHPQSAPVHSRRLIRGGPAHALQVSTRGRRWALLLRPKNRQHASARQNTSKKLRISPSGTPSTSSWTSCKRETGQGPTPLFRRPPPISNKTKKKKRPSRTRHRTGMRRAWHR